MVSSKERALVRSLNFLAEVSRARETAFMEKREMRCLLVADDARRHLTTPAVVDHLKGEGLVDIEDGMLLLNGAGRKRLIRENHGADGVQDPFQAQHRSLRNAKMRLNERVETVCLNMAESPLTKLQSKRTASGKPWLSSPALAAGERFRRDFDIGCLMPKVTSSWDPTRSLSGRSSGSGGVADLRDGSVDARNRIARALERTGPELGGVIVDFCCFLKGMQAIERERQWPARSAKFFVRTGLDLLASHYGTTAGPGGTGELVQWGQEGFRPQLFPDPST